MYGDEPTAFRRGAVVSANTCAVPLVVRSVCRQGKFSPDISVDGADDARWQKSTAKLPYRRRPLPAVC